jgi:hypothetical protein
MKINSLYIFYNPTLLLSIRKLPDMMRQKKPDKAILNVLS